MNNLMDESQLNLTEYQEVAFQEDSDEAVYLLRAASKLSGDRKETDKEEINVKDTKFLQEPC